MATLLKESNFTNSNNFKIRLEYSYTQSVTNNQTTITYYNYFVSMNSYSGSGANTTGYINGASVGTTTSIGKNEKKLLGSKSVTVTHNSDGTFPSTAYSASITCPWGGIGSASVSGNLTGLPTIPRASSPTLSSNNFNIGSSVTLTTNRKSTSFTHTVVLSFGSYSKTYTNVGDSQVIDTSQFASNMYAQIPNAKSGTGTITTTTYSGSTQIGSSSSLTFTANAIEGNVNPQISAITYSVDSTTTSLANSTTFIKGVTNATIRVTANRRMSATLTKVFLWYYSGSNKVVLSSQNVNADGTYTFTINGISVSKVYGGATDTRGYTTYNTSINNVPTTFKDYVTLTADTNATIKRIVQTEPNVRINSFTGNYWNGNFGSQSNSLTIKWRYKETTSSSYSAEYTIPASSISISNNKYTISNYTLTNGSTTELFNYQKAYNIQISVTDKIGTKSVVYTITAGQPNFAIFPSATISNNKMMLSYNNSMTELMNTTEVTRNATLGYTKETTTAGMYIRLFTLDMSAIWKSTSILFNVCGTQGPSLHALCELYVQKQAQTTSLVIHSFRFLSFFDYYDVGSRLVAIVTSTNKIEVYLKAYSNSDSPTCSIININKLRNADVYGKITMDCVTAVSSLPSGSTKWVDCGDNTDSYSTTEKRIGVWINGKALYRKTINFGSLPNATTKSVSTGLSNVTYVNIYGYATDGTYYWPLNGPRPATGNNYGIGCFINNNAIVIETGSNKTSNSAYVTIEYYYNN